MEVGGLKLWQIGIVFMLALFSHNPATGGPGFVGALIGSWVLVLLTRLAVGFVRERTAPDLAP